MPKRKQLASSNAEPITFGSACSGICSELFAAQLLNLNVKPIFACECDKNAMHACQHLWSHKMHFKDVHDPEFHRKAPHVQFFLAGFPCQPFSVQGLSRGVLDENNGAVIIPILRFIRDTRPTTFCLENVLGLLLKHSELLLGIMTFLKGLKDNRQRPLYTVTWGRFNARHHGLPQNRERILVVGVLNSKKTCEFSWPEAAPWLLSVLRVCCHSALLLV